MQVSRCYKAVCLSAVTFVAACGSGGDTSSPPPVVVNPPPPPPPVSQDVFFNTKSSASRLLNHATFGAGTDEVDSVLGTESSDWIVSEFDKPATLFLPRVIEFVERPDARNSNGIFTPLTKDSPTLAFWENAIAADDQLRQRVAFALSEIFVISHAQGITDLYNHPRTVAHYQDVLVNNAFGNFRDLLQDVTYAPAMGNWLTYIQNLPADPNTNRVPDENYAREVMQLFTIGLVELNPDGSPKLDSSGQPIETYDNDDVTGLAKVFTGLALEGGRYFAQLGAQNIPADAKYSPMISYDQFHSPLEKTFLDTTIPAGTGTDASITQALDTLFNHPNVGPFFGRQMIQRLVTSDPSPSYVERVAMVFESGRYTLPDGTVIGDGSRGDMKPFIAAILFDDEARTPIGNQSGKIREPIIRFTHFARAFDAETVTPEFSGALRNTTLFLGQSPFKSPSVFNFYRPGYVPPGTLAGNAGMTVPEMQITHASTVANYTNFMTYFALGLNATSNNPDVQTSFIPDYSAEIALAPNATNLIEHLDEKLLSGQMSSPLRTRLIEVIDQVPLTDPNDDSYDGLALRSALAVTMIMTSPDYIVQR